jgi:hypothetical protein
VYAWPVSIAVLGVENDPARPSGGQPVGWEELDALAAGADSPAQGTAPVDMAPVDMAPVVLAHIEGAALGGESSLSTVVHVATAGTLGHIRTVVDALTVPAVQGTHVGLVLVLPRGSIEGAGPELARLLRAHSAYQQAYMALTEDYDGRLAMQAAAQGRATELPATSIFHPSGQLLWQHVGHPELARHSEAFATHLSRGGQPQGRLLKLTVPLGAVAPNFAFDSAGKRASLSELRGKRVTLCFGKSWSEASLVQLRYLQAMQPEQSILLAIADGEESRGAEEAWRSQDADVYVVADPARHIAAAYGAPCWPTTVRITSQGQVGAVTYGMSSAARAWVRSAGVAVASRPRGGRAPEGKALGHGREGSRPFADGVLE